MASSWASTYRKHDIDGISPKSKGVHHWQTNRRKLEEKKLTREQELESENELLRAELAFIKKAPSLRGSYALCLTKHLK